MLAEAGLHIASLIPGAGVKVDGRTHNLVVSDGKREFYITGVFIAEVERFQLDKAVLTAWAALVGGLDKDANGVLFHPFGATWPDETRFDGTDV